MNAIISNLQYIILELFHTFIQDGELQMKALGSYSSTNSW